MSFKNILQRLGIFNIIAISLVILISVVIFAFAIFGSLTMIVALEIVIPLIVIVVLIYLIKYFVVKGDLKDEIAQKIELDDNTAIANAKKALFDNGVMVLREDIKCSSGHYGSVSSLIYTVKGQDYWNGHVYVVLVAGSKLGIRTSVISEPNPSPALIDKYLNEFSEKPERIFIKRRQRENIWTGAKEVEEEAIPESEKQQEDAEAKVEEEKI